MDSVYLAGLLSSAGGILSALVNWLNSKEPFDARKFLSSVIAAVVSGLTFGLAYDKVAVTPFAVVTCLLGGLGIDSAKNMALGSSEKLRGVLHGTGV